jgi:hypothetical protein
MAGQFCAIRGMTVRAFSTTEWTATNNNNILWPEAAMVKVMVKRVTVMHGTEALTGEIVKVT